MYLPEDIIHHILLRLPVKSLLRFTSVSHPWRDLILSDQFIDSHTKFGRHGMAIVLSTSDVTNYYEWRRPTEEYKILEPEFHSIAHRLQLKLNKDYQVIGHYNGIICLASRTHPCEILLWNPALQQCRALTPTHFHQYFAGFGYDSLNRDYKVVAVSRLFPMLMVYSLKNDSWKSINISPLKPFHSYNSGGLFFQGRIYWIRLVYGILDYCLFVFDLAKEEFLEFDLSGTFDRRDHFVWYPLRFFRGCVSLVLTRREHCIEIWSMKDPCIPRSWTKVADRSSMALEAHFDHLDPLRQWLRLSNRLTINGQAYVDIVEDSESETKGLDVHSRKRTQTVRKFCNFFVISDFMETLVAVIPKITRSPTVRP